MMKTVAWDWNGVYNGH